PVRVLLKGEVLGSNNAKRTNNLSVDVEVFHPTMVEVEIPQSLFEEQGRQFYGARLLDSGKHLTLFLLFSFIGNMKLTEEQLASLQHNLAVGDIFKCENLEFSTDELVKEVDNSITEFKKHKQEYDGECVKDLSIFFGIILDT
ncbi:unnamed protein product, partial [Brassica oleracea]